MNLYKLQQQHRNEEHETYPTTEKYSKDCTTSVANAIGTMKYVMQYM